VKGLLRYSGSHREAIMKLRINVMLVVVVVTGCAASGADKAAGVVFQNHSNMLMTNCSNLGVISVKLPVTGPDGSQAQAAAKEKARQLTADRGGDTMVNIGTDIEGDELTYQGTALRCN
jgi:hypothetical protein